MAELSPALTKVLRHEGGYVNDPDDRGGETKYGISKRAYPNLDIKSLTVGDAMAIYDEDYWQPLQLSQVEHQGVADLVFSLGVNMGTTAAARLLQQACSNLGMEVRDDGQIGPTTLSRVNALRGEKLLPAIKELAIRRYLTIAKVPLHSGQGRFLVGWLKRVIT